MVTISEPESPSVKARGSAFGRRSVGLLAMLGLIAAFATACTKPNGPGVAAVNGSPSPSSRASVIAFARCMRQHGVANFPDSGEIDSSSGIDPSSTQFRNAMAACRSLLSQGGAGEIPAKDQQEFLEFSACMRSHGVREFPDPDFSHGGAGIRIVPGQAGFDPSSARFQAAQTACQHLLPGGGPRGRIHKSTTGSGGAVTAGGGSA